MNVEADADLVRCFAMARRHAPADAAVTMLRIDAREFAVVSGRASDAPVIAKLPPGFAAAGPLSFWRDPPTAILLLPGRHPRIADGTLSLHETRR